jgi:hypothetical protein
MRPVGEPFRLRSTTGARLEIGLLAVSVAVVVGAAMEQFLTILPPLPWWANLIITALSGSLVGVTIYFSRISAHLQVGVTYLDGFVWPRFIRIGLVVVPIVAVGVSASLFWFRSSPVAGPTLGPVVSQEANAKADAVINDPKASPTEKGEARTVQYAANHPENFQTPNTGNEGPTVASGGRTPSPNTTGPSTTGPSVGQSDWPVPGPIVYIDKKETDEIRQKNQSIARQNSDKNAALIIAGLLFPEGAPVFAALGLGGSDIDTQTTLDIIHSAAVSNGKIDPDAARAMLARMTPRERETYISKLIYGLSQTDPPNQIPADNIQNVKQQLSDIADDLDKNDLAPYNDVVKKIIAKGANASVDEIYEVVKSDIGATPSNKYLDNVGYALSKDHTGQKMLKNWRKLVQTKFANSVTTQSSP